MFVIKDAELLTLEQLLGDLKRFRGFRGGVKAIQGKGTLKITFNYYNRRAKVRVVGGTVWADPPSLEVHLFMCDAERKRHAIDQRKLDLEFDRKIAQSEHVGDAGYTCPEEMVFRGVA